jgi:hypothetical protein
MASETGWNKKNLGKWIKALRSKRYPQAGGFLYDVERKGYCCLGVVQKISRVCRWDEERRQFVDKHEDSFKHCGNSFLTVDAAKWLGTYGTLFTADNPEIYLPKEYNYSALCDKGMVDEETLAKALPDSITCSSMNDSWHLTFPQIADMLQYFVYNNLPDAE